MPLHLRFAYQPGDLNVKVSSVVSTPDNSDIDRSNNTVGLSLTYILVPRIGVELATSAPIEYDLKQSGTGSFKQVPVTLSGQYYFTSPRNAFQPYVGLGLAYSQTSDHKGLITSTNNGFGYALSGGLDYQVSQEFLIGIGLIKVNDNSTVKFPRGSNGVDPILGTLSVGYSF